MAHLYRVSEKLNESHSGLHICSPRAAAVKVLQWQCKGELKADPDHGVYCISPGFVEKAKAFIRLALDTHADLVLTPEYSFPVEALEMIIHSPELWPAKGALWCLGTQGMQKDEFGTKMENWKRLNRVRVIDHAYFTLLNRTFVDPLLYLFRLDDDQLCVLPQFKTCHMSDYWSQYEGAYLSTGEVVYLFDLCGSGQDQNFFLSIICSDVLNVRSSYIMEKTTDKPLLIYHPQLNPNPRHLHFRLFRNDLFEFNTHGEKRLITLNWSAGSVVDGEVFNVPWSAYYRKGISNLHLNRQLRINNHDFGTYYAQYRHTEIWFSDREEHVKLFEINKGYQPGTAYTATAHPEPNAKAIYRYDSNTWLPSTVENAALEDIIGTYGEDYDYPLFALPHERDVFFGLCFGHFEGGELRTDDNELTSRLAIGSDEVSDDIRTRKAFQYRDLIKVLQRQRFPEELEYLIDNHMLKIDAYFAENGISLGNVYPKMTEGAYNPFASALFIITDKWSKSDVAVMVDEISKKLHPNFKNKIVVYYKPDGGKYKPFDDHLKETRITKAKHSRNLGSIKP